MEGAPKESDEGYAEEQPEEVAGSGGNEPREREEREHGTPDEAGPGDDGTATGNPRSAG